MKSIKNYSKNRLTKNYKDNKTISITENIIENINKNIIDKKYNLFSPLCKKKNKMLACLDVGRENKERKKDVVNYTVNNNVESIKFGKIFNNKKTSKNNKNENEKMII